MTLRSLMGLGGGPNTILTNRTETDSRIDPDDAFVAIRYKRNGNVARTYGVGSSTEYGDADWISAKTSTVGDGYEIKLTVISGATPAGAATGSWLALSSDREWSLSRTTVGTTTGSYKIEIRKAGTTPSTPPNCTVILDATVDV